MSPEAQIALWGLASAAPFLVNFLTKRSPDATGIGLTLLLGWSMERVLWASYGPPECTHLYPLLDAAIGTAVFVSWWSHRKAYKLGIVLLLALQCTGQLAYLLAPATAGSFAAYILANNVLYIPQLLLAGLPGIGYGLGALVHWLHSLAHPPTHVGA